MGKCVLTAVFVVTLALSTSGQQRTNATDATRQVATPPPRPGQHVLDLPAEPVVPQPRNAPATLREAAEANDYAAFESLYQRALRNRESLGAYTDLHEIWTRSQDQAAGSFFGADVYSKLVSRYPGFSAFIRDYRVVDRSGQPLYPSHETREFLLAEAIAEVEPAVAPNRPQPKQAESANHSPVKNDRLGAQTETTQRADEAIAPKPAIPTMPKTTETRAATTAPSSAPPSVRSTPPPEQKPPVDPVPRDHARTIFVIIFALAAIGVLTMTVQTSSGDVLLVDEDSERGSAHDARSAESHT